MSFLKYNNPTWEPCFNEISPLLAKFYFATNFGPMRYVLATLIFKKLSKMEDWVGGNES